MHAKVLRVEPLGERKVSALGVEEQRVKVVLSLQNPPNALGHGYRVDARVTVLERPNALLLPVESLIRAAQGWRAWVLTDGQHSMVTEGLGESDAVVPVRGGQNEGLDTPIRVTKS